MRATVLLLVFALTALTACASTQESTPDDRTPLPDRSWEGKVFRMSDAQLDRGPAIRQPSRVRYPDKPRALGLERQVFVTLVVGPDGHPYDVAIDPELNDATGLSARRRAALRELEHAAMEAVWRTTFTPGTVDGEPVAVQIIMPMAFSLGDG
jgi:outer membrane biosynthesis protein TonB